MPGKSLYGKTDYGLQPDGTMSFPKKQKLEDFDKWLKKNPVKKASKSRKTGPNSVNA